MNYTVAWTQEALQELAEEWTSAENRAAVAAAGNEIDQLLAISPKTQGESRRGTVRVMFVRPLGIEFEIIEDDRKVRVLTVWRVKPTS